MKVSSGAVIRAMIAFERHVFPEPLTLARGVVEWHAICIDCAMFHDDVSQGQINRSNL